LSSHNIIDNIGLSEVFSLSSMEAAIAFGASGASQDVFSFQRGGTVVFILSWRGKNVGVIAENWTDFADFAVLSSVNISWEKGIGRSCSLEICVCYISVINGSVLIITTWSPLVPNSSFCSLNIFNFHDISSREVQLSFFYRSCTWDIVNTLWVFDKLRCLRLNIGHALKLVTWVQWILWLPIALELNTLWSSPLKIIKSHCILHLVEAYMEVPWE
jgi:hypothetical protein